MKLAISPECPRCGGARVARTVDCEEPRKRELVWACKTAGCLGDLEPARLRAPRTKRIVVTT